MNYFKPLLLLTFIALLFSIRDVNGQDVTLKKKKSFSFFYGKASDQLNNNLDSANIYAMKALRYAGKDQVWHVHFLQALVFKKKREYHQSIDYYNLAMQNAKTRMDSMYTHNNLANAYYEAGKYKTAYKLAQKVVKYYKEINYTRIYDTYGIIAKLHSKSHRLDSAQHYFNKATNAIPTSHDNNKQITAEFLALKGGMYKENNKLDSAIVFYQEATQLQKTSYKRCEYFLNLADCYIRQSNFVASESYLEQAQKIVGNNFHNQIRLLQRIANIQAQKEQRKKLQVTYTEVQQLISANAGKLTNADLKMYITIQNDIHQKQQNLAAKAERKVARLAKAQMGGIWVLLAILVIITTLYFTKLRLKNLRQSHSDGVVKPINTKLKVSYTSELKENIEIADVFSEIRNLRELSDSLPPS